MMKKPAEGRDRLSIEVLPNEHRQIKVCAALHGQTIRDYVMESVRQRLRHETEDKEISALTGNFGEVFREVWDNEKDAEYDKL